MTEKELYLTALQLFQWTLNREGERVNALLENMSREDVWYLRERTEELYSACAYAFEVKED